MRDLFKDTSLRIEEETKPSTRQESNPRCYEAYILPLCYNCWPRLFTIMARKSELKLHKKLVLALTSLLEHPFPLRVLQVVHLEPDDAATTIDRNDADVERRRRVGPEEQPRGVAAQHVQRGHHGPEVSSEAGVHPVVDERVEH